MSRSREDQRRHDNFVDGMIVLAILGVVAIIGCNHSSAPPKDGEWRIGWQQDRSIPWPVLFEAHVPYEDADPGLTSYTPVTPFIP